MSATDQLDDPRTRVLAGVERLVAIHGFSKVRLRDVAQEAGVSIGALQHHFETRDRLLREAFLWSSERRITLWLQAPSEGADSWERLQSLFTGAFDVDDFRTRSAIWIEFCAAASRDADVRSVMQELYELWRRPLREIVHAGVAAGQFHLTVSVDDVVDILASQIDGLEIAALVSPDGGDEARLLALLLETARAVLGLRD